MRVDCLILELKLLYLSPLTPFGSVIVTDALLLVLIIIHCWQCVLLWGSPHRSI